MSRGSSGFYGWWGKRVVDLSLALPGLLLVSPLLGLLWAVVRWRLGPPVLFRQERPGRGGAPFQMFKFRTMRAPKPGEVWFRSDEERLTPLGRLIRKLSLDELPTLWNVLRGDMSLVGPRPLLMEYLPKYTPEQNRRHEVRPGITGWAQVNGRQTIPFSRRLELDVWYVDHLSFALDMRILWLTFEQLLWPTEVIPGQNVDDVDDLGLSADPDKSNKTPEGP